MISNMYSDPRENRTMCEDDYHPRRQGLTPDHSGYAPDIKIKDTLGTSMDFQMKERKRRTVSDQIEFNMQRIEMLHKELSELKQMLKPYTVDHAEREQTMPKDGTGEVNSEMMYTLLRETAMINDLILYVTELKKDLQV